MGLTQKRKPSIRIFPRNRSFSISTKGKYQRYIIVCLAQQLSSMTKGAIAKELARRFKIPIKSAYTHAYQELNENLVPRGIVEVEGFLPATRGPKIVQVSGVPCFRLSPFGILVAASLNELRIKTRAELLQRYLNDPASHQTGSDKDDLLSHLDKFPEFTLDLVRHSVSEFLEGRAKDPLEKLSMKNNTH
jgi:hypothetical protein